MAKKTKPGFNTFFLTGFLALLPLFITIMVLRFAWNLVSSWIEPVMEALLGLVLPASVMSSIEKWLLPLPTLLGIALAVLLIFLAGVGFRWVMGRAMFGVMDKLLEHIPLVSGIYHGVRQITSAFAIEGPKGLRQVVLIRPIRGGSYMMGFLTNHTVLQKGRQRLAQVYVPTNTMYTGDLYLVGDRDYIPLRLTVEEGVKMIVSGGLVTHRLIPARHKGRA